MFGFAIAVVLLALGLQPWDLALSRVERSVVARIEERTGLKVTALRRAEFAFLPLPRISLSDVTFTDSEGRLSGKAVRLKARARLLPLFGGQVEFDRVDLVAPELDIAVPDGKPGLAPSLAQPLGYLRRLQSKLVISAGSIMARSGGAILTTLRDVNLVAEEREANEPIAVAGGFTWRGEPAKLDLLWPIEGERARVALALSARPMSLRLSGTRSAAQGVANGQVEFSTKSLSDALAWLGPRPRIAGLVREVELAAQAQFTPGDVSLSNVTVKLDGDQLEGALKLDGTMPNWALSGTLAGAEFDLGRLLRRSEPQPAGSAQAATPLEFDSWTTNDVDLRISLDSGRIGTAELRDLAAQLLVRKGRFEASLLRAGAYNGTARARILATAVPNGAEVKLQLGLDRLNLALAAEDLPKLARLSGTASGQLAFDGTGDTVEQVVNSLTGRANLTIRQGEFRGVSFPDLLRRAEKPAPARDWRQGKTSFETLQLNALANLGVLYVTDAQMTGAGYTLGLTGTADLGRRWLDLTGALAASAGSARLPFVLKGPFSEPVFLPEIEAAGRALEPALLLTR